MSTVTFLKRYKVLSKIGEGSFSEVVKCKDTRTGDFIAAKRLKKRFDSLEEVFACAEIIAMQKITRHRNVLYMSEFHFDAYMGKVIFLFELMDMSLYDFMRVRKRVIPESRAKNYLYQILCGVNHLHKNGLFHRDIKPENILIKIPLEEYHNRKYELIKLADLGSIRGVYSQLPYTEYISTRWYRSPECLLTSGYYGPKMDVWATGCVFFEMLTLKPLFPGCNEVDQLTRIHSVLGTPSSKVISKFKTHKSCNCEMFSKLVGTGLSPLLINVSSDGQSILKQMLIYDPDLRASTKKLLAHRYFTTFKDPGDKLRHNRLLMGTSSMKLGGDYRGSMIMKPPSKFRATKFGGIPDRPIRTEIFNFKKSVAGKTRTSEIPKRFSNYYSNIGKQTSEIKEPKEQEVKKSILQRKPTNNYPPRKNLLPKSTHQSRSVVLQRICKKRLEPIPEIPIDDITIPKPPKILMLDPTMKPEPKPTKHRNYMKH